MKNDIVHHQHLFLAKLVFAFCFAYSLPVAAQEKVNQQEMTKSMAQTNSMLDKFSRKCERRTKRAERRFARYERKIKKFKDLKFKDLNPEASSADSASPNGEANQKSKIDNQKSILNLIQDKNQKCDGLGKDPLLDSLRLIHAFSAHAGMESDNKSLDRAQEQLNISQRTKSDLLARKEYWKAQIKDDPKSLQSKIEKWLSKMEKERYYYTAQINEYRKTLRDPSNLDEKLMAALRRDPRFGDFMATLPAKPQDPAKMQPRQMVQQMMQTQAAAINADPAKLLKDARQKGSDMLGKLSQQASSFGNMDNAAQMPKFTPNPYKTKSFWQRVNLGFNLQFDNRTQLFPSTTVAGAQAAFNFDPKFSVGVLGNYRFGMGEIKNIRFSHAGAGYGAFAHYKVWKSVGVQAGYERNWRDQRNIRQPETVLKPETLNLKSEAWTSSALLGLTWEYGVGKKAKGTVGVFFDALYKQHTPATNAVLWRMGVSL